MGLLGTIPPPSLAIHRYSRIYRLSAGCIQAQLLVTSHLAWDSGQTIWDDLNAATLAVIGPACMGMSLADVMPQMQVGVPCRTLFAARYRWSGSCLALGQRLPCRTLGMPVDHGFTLVFGDILGSKRDHIRLTCLLEQWTISCAAYQHVFANSTRRRQQSGEQPYKRKRTLHLLSNPLHAFSKAAEQLSVNLL